MRNSYMKSAYLPANHDSRGLLEYLQKDVSTGSGCIHRVLLSKFRWVQTTGTFANLTDFIRDN